MFMGRGVALSVCDYEGWRREVLLLCVDILLKDAWKKVLGLFK